MQSPKIEQEDEFPEHWPESWMRWIKGDTTPEEVRENFPEPPEKAYGYGGPEAEDQPVR